MEMRFATLRREGSAAISRVLGAAVCLAVVLLGGASANAVAAPCPGDCNGDEVLTAADVAAAVRLVLGERDGAGCIDLDRDHDGSVRVNDLVALVGSGPSLCSLTKATPTATPSQESPTFTITPTQEPPTFTPTPTLAGGAIRIEEVVRRDALGNAVHLSQVVTTEGVLTGAAGLFANNKLKVFAQDGGYGVMVYHQSSADVSAYAQGDRLRVTGVVQQKDATSPDNPSLGTVIVDITDGASTRLSGDNPLPAPTTLTVAAIVAGGIPHVGTLVRVDGLRKVAGDWPLVGSRSTQVSVSDDEGASVIGVRFQRNTITSALVQALDQIGDGEFSLIGVLLQNDEDNNGSLLGGMEIWPRGVEDVL